MACKKKKKNALFTSFFPSDGTGGEGTRLVKYSLDLDPRRGQINDTDRPACRALNGAPAPETNSKWRWRRPIYNRTVRFGVCLPRWVIARARHTRARQENPIRGCPCPRARPHPAPTAVRANADTECNTISPKKGFFFAGPVPPPPPRRYNPANRSWRLKRIEKYERKRWVSEPPLAQRRVRTEQGTFTEYRVMSRLMWAFYPRPLSRKNRRVKWRWTVVTGGGAFNAT